MTTVQLVCVGSSHVLSRKLLQSSRSAAVSANPPAMQPTIQPAEAQQRCSAQMNVIFRMAAPERPSVFTTCLKPHHTEDNGHNIGRWPKGDPASGGPVFWKAVEAENKGTRLPW